MRKWKTMIALVAACFASGQAVAESRVAAARAVLSDNNSTRTLTIAHRACWKEAPENSLAAIAACKRIGIDGIELDVRHTKDGVAVIIHDETVDRTTNGKGKVADLTWAEISRLRLRDHAGGPDSPLTSQRIQTLDAYLDAIKDDLLVVYDVKDWSQQSTFDAITKHKMTEGAIFFYECKDNRLLDKVRPFFDKVVMFPIMFEKDGPLLDQIAQCPSNPAGRAHIKYQDVAWADAAAPGLRTAHQRTWIATMFPADNGGFDDHKALSDPAAVWGAQIAAGAQMIMTNEPRALVEYLKSR